MELERIYSIKNGGSQFSGNQYVKKEELTNKFTTPTESDLAKQLHMTRQQLQNYKKLSNLIPKLQALEKYFILCYNILKYSDLDNFNECTVL